MKITYEHRKKLKFYLDNFYEYYRHEKFTILHFVRYFKRRLKDNQDAWMGVCGDTGTGKSLFVLMSMILFGRPMSLTDNIAYIPRGDEIIEMFKKLNFQTLLIDEAAREMRAVNWQSKAQQSVNVAAMTERFKNNWVFLNMPNFLEFTKSMKVGNMKFRCIVPYRTDLYARIIVQRKSRNWRHPDPWGDDYAMKRYERAESKAKELDNQTILAIERSLPQTVMDFIIPNLEIILPDVTSTYDRLKNESRDKTDVLDDKKQEKLKKLRDEFQSFKARIAQEIFYNKHGIGKVTLTQTDLAEILGVSQSTVKKYLSTDLDSLQGSALRKKLIENSENSTNAEM